MKQEIKNKPGVSFHQKEIFVMQLLCREFSDEQIALALETDVPGVEKCKQLMLNRLSVRELSSVLLYMVYHNILPLDKL